MYNETVLVPRSKKIWAERDTDEHLLEVYAPGSHCCKKVDAEGLEGLRRRRQRLLSNSDPVQDMFGSSTVRFWATQICRETSSISTQSVARNVCGNRTVGVANPL